MQDMKALRVQPPDLLTRVTEYVPETVAFIAKIMDRGLAYAIDSDVYFDTRAFDGAALGSTGEDAQIKHWYLKLEPWSKSNSERAEEGEGEPSAIDYVNSL
jgi:cysteinyl-tRNA synthetase